MANTSLSTKVQYHKFLTSIYPNSPHTVKTTIQYTFKPPSYLGQASLDILLERINLFQAYKADKREWLQKQAHRLERIREKLIAETGDFELT